MYWRGEIKEKGIRMKPWSCSCPVEFAKMSLESLMLNAVPNARALG